MYEFNFDLDEFLEEASKNYSSSLKAQDKSNTKCGEFSSFVCATTGRMKFFKQKCNDFRNCPQCMADRKRDIVKKIADTAKHHETGLYELTLKESDYRKVRDRLGTNKLVRLPTQHGLSLFVCADEDELQWVSEFAAVSETSVGSLQENDMHLSYLCNTPVGKNISGGYVEPIEKEPENYVEVSRVVFHIGSQELTIRLNNMAIERTKHLNPTAETLQDAINQRQYALEEAAEELGVKIWLLAQHQVTRVDVTKINWQLPLHTRTFVT